jgi:uncharacterized protein (DUF4415 family)
MPRKKIDENPEWTKADFNKATKYPRGMALKDLAAKVARGRPKLENPKQVINIRLDSDIIESYRKTGMGWQTRINSDLRKARKLKAS